MRCLKLIRTRSPFSNNCVRYLSTDLWNHEISSETLKETEEYWKKQFRNDDLFDKNKLDKKYYLLSMFPYPSGNLHMGHVRVYTISDALARYHRMRGKNVFQPIGWDAFGLPAENAAFERGSHPEEWTKKNIAHMKEQLKKLCCTFDWSSELATCDPQYYRWTQYIFLKMYDAGLVYQKAALVNWDPVDGTVLAEEQVDENGCSWRSGAKVEKRVLKQWFIRTTKFAKELREGLEDPTLNYWTVVSKIQKNWIAKCDGFAFDFPLENVSGTDSVSLNIWVKSPRSALRAEFVAVLPNSMADILDTSSGRGTQRKLNLTVVNPFTKRSLPIYVTTNVQYPFARDVCLGVPSEVEADKQFAETVGLQLTTSFPEDSRTDEELCAQAIQKGIGGYAVSSRLQDWLISRQRYWGTPIPMVHCATCGTQPVPYEQLPVTLPVVPEDHPVGEGLHNLLKESDWKNTVCPKCKGTATREVDTMDTFVDSTWYYLRFVDPHNKDSPFDSQLVNQMTPVDMYVGGLEHAVLHLYYARFVSHFLHSIGLINYREPFSALLTQGMVKGKTYKDKAGRYIKSEDIKMQGKHALKKDTGEVLTVSWEKMSKSKYNGVEPEEVLEKYGVDTTRLFLMFSISPRSHRNWEPHLFADVLKWQHRLWLTIHEFLYIRKNPIREGKEIADMTKYTENLREKRYDCIRDTTHSFKHSQQLSSAIAYLQGFTNVLRNAPSAVRKYCPEYELCLASFIIMLTPLAPHFASTLWYGFTSAPDRLNTDTNLIKWDEGVITQRWPKMDPNSRVQFKIRVNSGKKFWLHLSLRKLEELNEEEALNYALLHPVVQKIVCRDDILKMSFEKYEDSGAFLDIRVDNARYQDPDTSSDEEAEKSSR